MATSYDPMTDPGSGGLGTSDDYDGGSGGSFYQRNKTAVWGVGALVLGGGAYLLLKSRSSTASTNANAALTAAAASVPTVDLVGNANPTGSSSTTSSTGQGGNANSGFNNRISQLEQLMQLIGYTQTLNPQGPSVPTISLPLQGGLPPAATTSTPTTTQTSIPTNQYYIGENLQPLGGNPGESIVNSVYDPNANSWLNLTNQGGVYTSAGLGLSGSAIGAGNFAGGNISYSGNTFTETMPNGQSYTYQIN